MFARGVGSAAAAKSSKPLCQERKMVGCTFTARYTVYICYYFLRIQATEYYFPKVAFKALLCDECCMCVRVLINVGHRAQWAQGLRCATSGAVSLDWYV